EGVKPGELLLLKDHINLMGDNPLRGSEAVSFGDRFVNMKNAYDFELRELVKTKFGLREAVYAALSGPSYETPAEIKALRLLGADVVGMSVVPEVIVARQMGLRVLGIVGVANLAGEDIVTHQEVLKAMSKCKERLREVISFCLGEL
ncbi:MAG: purine-nucleoside phosphorylase, partial [Chloroflexi bacterium]|nr:purine-nucleoside phosphorylase [Chloroflexota bacterium]